jgi:hypothetical protein
MADPILRLYADCIHLPCDNCHAVPGCYCRNPITKVTRRTPCVVRDRAADAEAINSERENNR